MNGIIPKDYTEEGISRLSDNLSKEDIQKLLSIFLEELQEIEDSMIDLAQQKSIDIAEGIWLDYIGQILGIERQGLDDVAYRKRLKFKISVNTADGTPDIISSIVRQFTESSEVEIYRSGTAYFSLYFNGRDNIGSELYNLMLDISPAGVNFTLHNDYYNNAFRFAYEQELSPSESLQVTEDSFTFANRKITLDGDLFQDLLVRFEGITKYDQATLVEGFNSFYWEEPVNLQVTENGFDWQDLILVTQTQEPDSFELYNGEDLVLDVDFGVEEVFEPEGVFVTEPDFLKVMVPYLEGYIPENLITFTWEVNENSTDVVEEITSYEDFQLFDDDNLLVETQTNNFSILEVNKGNNG